MFAMVLTFLYFRLKSTTDDELAMLRRSSGRTRTEQRLRHPLDLVLIA